MRLKRTIDLLDDRNEIEQVGIEEQGDRLIAGDNDPQMHVKLYQPLLPGWYKIVAEVNGDETRNPTLYLDSGFRYNQGSSVVLDWNLRSGKYSAIFAVSAETHLVRFDPSDRACAFRLGAVELRRVSRPELATEIVPVAFRMFRDNPRRFIRNMPAYLRRLASPGFGRLVSREHALAAFSYDDWLSRFDYQPERDDGPIAGIMAGWKEKPLISVVTPTYNTPADLLSELYQSLQAQVYDNWEFCVADDASTKPHVRRLLEKLASRDSRVKVTFRDRNGHISQASNSALALATGDILTLADHDDRLHPLALYHIAKRHNENPGWRIMYSDEDKIDSKGHRSNPYFKGDFNRDLFYCHNMMTHLIVYRRQDILDAGGFREGFEGSQDYDLALRILERVEDAQTQVVHIPHVLYHWRAIEGSIAMGADQKSYAHDRARKAINEHFERIGSPARSIEGWSHSVHRVEYPVDTYPLFSIIICTRDKADLLRTCVESIFDRTEDRNFEIVIVDNGSEESVTLTYLSELADIHDNVSVVRDNGDFNFSRLNNVGVAASSGEYICLLNNDTEVIAGNWLDAMRMHLGRKEVGAVGGKLLYGNGTIQHAGIIMGLGGLAAHGYAQEPADTTMNVGKAQLTQQVRAVTGACLATKREVWDMLGGLDDEVFKVAYNDVDYCLKLWRSRLSVIYEPAVELYHHESLSRGSDEAPEKVERFRREQRAMKERWGRWTDEDVFFNPNLDYGTTSFTLSPHPRVSIID